MEMKMQMEVAAEQELMDLGMQLLQCVSECADGEGCCVKSTSV
jgi:hypothetical protein